MPAENRDVRGNELKPAIVRIGELIEDPDGNEHTGTLATTDNTASDPHDNTAHSTNYAPDPHDNTAHSTNYAPDGHDNTAHSLAFVSDGDGIERQIWVIAAGAADPAGAGPDDIIFEEQ